jgi:predicted transcriptional regulator
MADTQAASIFDTEINEAEETRLDAIADAEIDKGLFISHEQVGAWLKSGRKHDILPRPLPPPR